MVSASMTSETMEFWLANHSINWLYFHFTSEYWHREITYNVHAREMTYIIRPQTIKTVVSRC